MTKFVLNETSYFGKGAREELPREIKERGFKKVLVVTNNEGKLAYTGNTANVVAIAISSIAVVALAAIIVNKKIAAKAE